MALRAFLSPPLFLRVLCFSLLVGDEFRRLRLFCFLGGFFLQSTKEDDRLFGWLPHGEGTHLSFLGELFVE